MNEFNTITRFFTKPILISGGILVLALVIVGWISGFVSFAEDLRRISTTSDTADAIVVLTGGDERIAEAVDLLVQNQGARLLISGVHPDTPSEDIRKLVNADAQLFTCCVDLDRRALDTIGNAKETASWAQEHDYESLIVVTADYHMPRSLLEFKRFMPQMDIRPYPIRSPGFEADKWWHSARTLRFLAAEYNKYLASLFRIRFLSFVRFSM